MSEVETHKRKISDGAPLASDLKRHKGDDDSEADTASLAATDGSDDKERDENLRSVSDTPTADATEPLIFYCWADALISMFHEDEEPVYVVLKPTALEAWEHVKHLPKENRYEALGDHIKGVRQYDVTVPEGATGTPEAKALEKVWDAVMRETKMGDGDGDDDGSVGWWYEVDAQREKPKEGPALELRFDWKETWWITGFRESDTEGRRAMCTLVDYLCVDY